LGHFTDLVFPWKQRAGASILTCGKKVGFVLARSQKGQGHIPVMPDEVIEAMDGPEVGLMIDGTVGSGGHSAPLLEAYPRRSLLGIDLDMQALSIAEENLKCFESRSQLAHGNYTDMSVLSRRMGEMKVCGILLDLGLSSMQIDDHSRGFSIKNNGVLDMRFDQTSEGRTARDILNKWAETDLANLFYEFGEERRSRRIASEVIKNRPIVDTDTLAKLVTNVIHRKRGKVHPATRVFQALRIAVNMEIENVRKGLKEGALLLGSGGKFVVITYHSLEDRMVKRFFRKTSANCVCPAEVIVCNCDHQPLMRVLTKKVIKPSMDEISNNFRSRSAKLRVAQKL
jgi:16S rRNA (cytosine1402-N4)-methyltransferase